MEADTFLMIAGAGALSSFVVIRAHRARGREVRLAAARARLARASTEGDYLDALRDYERCSLHPRHVTLLEPLCALAAHYANEERSQDALVVLTRAIDIAESAAIPSPDVLPWLLWQCASQLERLGETDRAVEVGESAIAKAQALEVDETKLAQPMWDLATILYRARRFEACAELLRALVDIGTRRRAELGALAPLAFTATASLAAVALELERPDEAETHASAALAMSEGSGQRVTALQALGRARVARGEVARGYETLHESSKEARAAARAGGDPRDLVDSLLFTGDTATKLGRHEEARALYEEIVELLVNDPGEGSSNRGGDARAPYRALSLDEPRANALDAVRRRIDALPLPGPRS